MHGLKFTLNLLNNVQSSRGSKGNYFIRVSYMYIVLFIINKDINIYNTRIHTKRTGRVGRAKHSVAKLLVSHE